MDAVEIVERARRMGIVLSAEDGVILARPKGVTPPDLAEAIRALKPDLLRLLARPEPPAAPCPGCDGCAFWRHRGPWVCERCHPPVIDPLERFAVPVSPRRVDTATPNSRNPLIPDVIRDKISAIETEARVLGWPPELLYGGSFWNFPRALSSVLDDDDEIIEVTRDYIAILRVRRDLLRFARAH